MERIAGRYLLLKALARGGMGEVHLARQSGLDGFEKLVVIKRILPELAENPEFTRLFLDEARVAADLRHPNVVNVLEVGSDGGTLFLAMEYVHGVTLRRVQRRASEARRALSKSMVLSAVIDIARGLHYAHRKTDLRGQPLSIVHRDVSPQNVLVGFDGTARLLDFGIARAANRRERTEPGIVIGKLDYMSPEQASGIPLEPSSDQYSLGILLWELTVGEQMFRGSDETVREAVRTANITRPSDRISGYPVELERIVMRALAYRPAERYADCGELLGELEAFATKAGIPVSAEKVATFMREIFPAESDENFVLQGVVLPDGDPLDGDPTQRERGVITMPERFEGNVPPETGLIIGREADLETLRGLVSGSRLVTVYGPGGAGKTRLSLAYAYQHMRAQKEPVWFCDLSEARTVEGALGAVSAGLVIPPAEDAAVVSKAFGQRGKGLVVIDNAEQIVEAVASLVQRWLAEAPDIRFLVTSRETLRIPGEATHELGPLSLPEETTDADVSAAHAVRLFVERARAVRSAPFSNTDLKDIAKLVRALDGLPLAIELAAARMHVLAPRKLLERFDKRFDVLASGRRDAAARQATLRGAIDWSWNLLDPFEREALAQVSLFRGGFTLEAAEAVLALGEGAPLAIDAVQSLREKSLVRELPSGTDGELRFGLYESIREFAAERLATSGGRAAAERRHSDHYVAAGRELSQRIDEASGADARKQLAFEVDNLVAAHRRALAPPRAPDGAARALRACLCLDPIMSTRGPYRFFVKLVDEALAAHDADGGGADPETICRAHLARGLVLRAQGSPARAKADLERALAGAEALGDQKLRGRALRALAYVAWDEGRVEESRAVYEQALAASRLAGDRSHVGRILLELAGFDHEGGRLPTARAQYLDALEALRRCGDRRFEGVALGFLGCLLQELGELPPALVNFDAAIAIHRDGEDRRYEGIFAGYRGTLHHERGNSELAAAAYSRAVASLHEVGDPRSAALFEGFHAALEAESGRFDAARLRIEAATEPLAKDMTLSPMLEGIRGLVDFFEGGEKREQGVTRLESVRPHASSTFDVRIVLRLYARALAASS